MSASDSEDSSSSYEGNQIRVSFHLSAECADKNLAVPTEAIAVPADIGRKGLSVVINHLLDRNIDNDDSEHEDDNQDDSSGSNDNNRLPAIAFDFCVGQKNKKSRLLRTTLEQQVRRDGISMEQAVVITYFPAQQAPSLYGQSDVLPDWISALSSFGNAGLLACACYDGSLHILNASSTNLRKVSVLAEAHQGPIKCMAVSNNDNNTRDDTTQSVLVATGPMDHSLKIHRLNTEDNANDYYLHTISDCINGHNAAIASVDFYRDKLLASGDWDGGVCIWNTDTNNEQEESEQQANKKSRTIMSDTNKSRQQEGITTTFASISLQAHSSQVSGLSWGNYSKSTTSTTPETIYTASWDHCVKVWNVERQDCLLTLNGSRVISCMDSSYSNAGILVTGHPDCTLRLWDVRTNEKETLSVVSDSTFRPSHKAWVSAVQWSPANPYHIASTSHDGTVKLWDIRSSIPVVTVRPFDKENKGLALAYGTNAETLYAGGTDCIVKQFRHTTSSKEKE